jgi:GNAT superfamily N-acetyltransferase
MWRPATERDDADLAELCVGLYREDPGPLAGGARHLLETLATLRHAPWRGRAVVLDVAGRVAGYALLIAYWSNEFGGEVCSVDELYVAGDLRGRGHGAALFEAIERGEVWPTPLVAVALGVTPANAGARRLYERLGFVAVGVSMVRRCQQLPSR